MRVLILTPWENAWIPYYTKVFAERGHQVLVDHDGSKFRKADVYLHMWAGLTKPVKKAINICFFRRFEFFDCEWRKQNWSVFDKVIFCNSFFMKEFKSCCEADTELIYNAVDLDSWTFAEHGAGEKIGMACHVHPKKNLGLASQILAALPDYYELHIAGQIQDICTAVYLQTRCKNIFLYDHVEDMNKWWEDKNYCLSTSLSEGNPNNVLEAMAKGIKPIVHSWPGSEDQFDGHIFNTVDEACSMVLGEYGTGYREYVAGKFGLDNFRRVVDIVEDM